MKCPRRDARRVRGTRLRRVPNILTRTRGVRSRPYAEVATFRGQQSCRSPIERERGEVNRVLYFVTGRKTSAVRGSSRIRAPHRIRDATNERVGRGAPRVSR